MPVWLSKILTSALSGALTKFASRLYNEVLIWIDNMKNAARQNKEMEKETAKQKESVNELKDDLEKAGDDVDAQKEAAKDYFNRSRK